MCGSTAKVARKGGACCKYSTVELGVQGSPVCALVKLMEAACGLGGKQNKCRNLCHQMAGPDPIVWSAGAWKTKKRKRVGLCEMWKEKALG